MLQQIEEKLTASELESGWQETLSGWTGEPAVADELRKWITQERDSVLELARSAMDPVDLETGMMVRYIELRSQWIRYNALSNYTLLRTGEAPMDTMFRGSLVSSLIELLEPFINKEDLRKACDFLATPISQS